jgi:serine/threonine protein kinase
VDYFHMQSRVGTHVFLVFNLMAETLLSFSSINLFTGYKVLPKIVKKFLKQILLALDYTHKAGVIHTGLFIIALRVISTDPETDIKTDNIMIQLPDDNIIEDQYLTRADLPEPDRNGSELDFLHWPNSQHDFWREKYGIDYDQSQKCYTWQIETQSMKYAYFDHRPAVEELLSLNIAVCD